MTITVEIETVNGIEQKEITLNSLPHTVTLRQFVDADLLIKEAGNATDLLTGAVAITEATPKQVIDLYAFCTDFLKIFVTDGAEYLPYLKVGGSEATELINIFNTIFTNIRQYEPSERKEFTFKGRRYIVPSTSVTVFGKKLSADTTVLQNILAFELERIYLSKDKEGNEAIRGGQYHSIIGVMACLCMEVFGDGTTDTLPISDKERDAYMGQKISFFGDMTMNIALDVDFFLQSSNNTFGNILSFATHLRGENQQALKTP
jgi:hypothetical protein